ncbi:MAG: PspA/IM30 family protein [Planctomycetia bacterium]|nr:PspA/IM30 family protein [Planctomycetia bacterium]
MGIVGRTGDIITANVNDALDRMENPERMLKQAVRQMDEEVVRHRHELATTIAACHALARQLSQGESLVELWSMRAAAAVRAGDDGLAKKAIARRLMHETGVAELRSQLDGAQTLRDTARAQIDTMQARHLAARRQLGTLTLRRRAADIQARAAQLQDGMALGCEVTSRLERLRRKVEIAEAVAESRAELAAGPLGTIATAARFYPHNELDLDVEAELLRIKQTVNTP